MAKLEICCFGIECAQIAQEFGADRIELCSGAAEGGLTPSYGCLKHARKNIHIPVHPIVRPRGGDFCYNTMEFEVIKDDVQMIRELGFPGVVVGMLDSEGRIDLPRMELLMRETRGLEVTFHRAFDMCVNPLLALEQLKSLGIARILTSGQQQNAELGLPLLKQLNDKSREINGPIIMAGAGVRLSNLTKFIEMGITELHSSAGKTVSSSMNYRKVGVTMASNSETDEFTHYCVDGLTVEAMKDFMSLTNNLH
ncbi:copper homeostasis protein CutC [Moellerella wisconsensis]|uniref:PF03932 family protein CutC n=3 Tax=Moellerella wisconsensis TaxID=158849 RepID=A0A0N0IAN6_9GAMM|nr:copper homeostasis protein CutC [Moellerella wisconsensis]KPD02891.1 cytoplasmic copper homeostasis protein [Moellerella wisconsensis ATCC 35017]UNH25501.1 copper homeostasis protein CutC [Moellerella wisconsensis]UNH28686.1 copper homeostasis protein CutC [Moellerella wisconsensis]UNH32138.1 copper homeostasis protein CutC [Moellerella wisconsensis]UNH40288.1 copper homeostasis protein CutC [Moellerella wisconsensis]